MRMVFMLLKLINIRGMNRNFLMEVILLLIGLFILDDFGARISVYSLWKLLW